MSSQFSLHFSDHSGDYHLQLKEVDHQKKNSIAIAGRSYKIKGSEAAITQLKSHLKVNKFENFHQFKASLQANVGVEKKVSVVFQKIIKKSDQPNVSLYSTPVEAGHIPLKSNEVEAISAIQSKVITLEKENKFSGTLIIARSGGGDPLIAKSVGFANIELRQKNNLETQFNIASIGKIFTAVGVLQLVEEDKLSLEDPIGKYLPEITDEKMKNITIHQLLTHTGGTGSIEGDFRATSHFKDYIKVSKGRKPLFDPGTQCKYSNFGFVLLGAIIEKIEKKDYYQYIQERVFDIAGMQHSTFPLKGAGVCDSVTVK